MAAASSQQQFSLHNLSESTRAIILGTLQREVENLNSAISELQGHMGHPTAGLQLGPDGQPVKRKGRPPLDPAKRAALGLPPLAPNATPAATKRAVQVAAAAPVKKARKRTFTPEQRQAQAERMRAYWASHNKATKKAAKKAPAKKAAATKKVAAKKTAAKKTTAPAAAAPVADTTEA